MSRETCQSILQADTDTPYRTFHKMIQCETTGLLIAIYYVLLLTGCSHSGGGAATPDANPVGFYSSGNASIDIDNDGVADDVPLEAMINDGRIMIMSVEELGVTDGPELLYDGDITNINGNDFTASLDVYRSGVFQYTARINDGSIVGGGGSKITGTFVGADTDFLANGSFELLYSDNNKQFADLTLIETDSVTTRWSGKGFINFTVDVNGVMHYEQTSAVVPFSGCEFSQGKIEPIPNTALFSVNLVVENNVSSALCSQTAIGDYSGLAVTRPGTIPGLVDIILVMAVSNGVNAGYDEFILD